MTVPILPEWSTSDEVDPISGQQNVVEPPPEKKTDGWVYQEKPNRQYMNWLGRQTYLSLQYLYDQLGVSSATQPWVPSIGGITTYTFQNGFYRLVGDICYVNAEIGWSASDGGNMTSLDLPFPAKNVASVNQTLAVNRGTGPTLATRNNLFALLDPNTTNFAIWAVDSVSGVGAVVPASAAGQIFITGFYFVEL